MQAPPSHRNDASIPLLTEVLELPSPPSAAPAPVASRAAAPAPAPAATQPPVPDETLVEQLREVVLQDLHQRIDPLLKARMREHIESALVRVMDELTAGLHEELGQMVEEALHKELIRRAALQSSRPRDEVAE